MQADYMKFINFGLMPLNVDKLTYDTIELAHNGKQKGDIMADPDMEKPTLKNILSIFLYEPFYSRTAQNSDLGEFL